MRKMLVITGFGLILLLFVGYLALLNFASRADTATVVSIPYAPRASLLVLIGPQSVCPPLVMCPQFQQKPKAISAWIISDAPDQGISPIWQIYAGLQHRKLLYIRTP